MARLAALIVSISVVLAVVWSGPLVYAYTLAFDLIAPGVQVRGLDLDWLTVPQAAARLEQAWNVDRRIELGWIGQDGVHSWLVTAPEVGIRVDVSTTSQRAYAVGRSQGVPAGFFQVISGLWQSREIPLALSFDPQAARTGLETISAQANRAPQNAAFRLEGSRLVAVPGAPGATLDVEKALAALSADPYSVLFQGYLVLPMQPVAPKINDVSAIMADAERLLDASSKIYAYDPVADERYEWAVPRETLAGWLSVQDGENGPQLGLEAGKMADFLAAQGETLGAGRWLDVEGESARLAHSVSKGKPLTLIVKHRPTTYTVQRGDTLIRIGWNVGMPYWLIVEANPGLDENSLWVGQQITIPSKDELLPLPVVPNKRIVISISEQRLWTYQNGKQRTENVISTGIDRSPTQPGVFQVRTHELEAYASVWDLYMPHFLGIYEAWPGFMNGIHGLPTLSNGQRLWANILGRPASFGCIILNLGEAEDLYNWAEEGVPVEIRP